MTAGRTTIPRCAAALAALALVACESPYLTEQSYYEDPPSGPLDGQSIRSTLIGQSIISERSDGPYTVFFPDAGQVVGVRSFHYRDRGTWRVTEDEICIRWDNWWSNVERCWQVKLDGGAVTWLHPYGQSEELGLLVSGNPAGLE